MRMHGSRSIRVGVACAGALLLYIALDVFENGTLDGGVYRALRHDDPRSGPQRVVP